MEYIALGIIERVVVVAILVFVCLFVSVGFRYFLW